MIGDRYLTDVVYGNRNGMFSVCVAPIQQAGETAAVKLVRSAATPDALRLGCLAQAPCALPHGDVGMLSVSAETEFHMQEAAWLATMPYGRNMVTCLPTDLLV